MTASAEQAGAELRADRSQAGGDDYPGLIEAVSRRIQHTLDLAAHEVELAAVSALVMVILIVFAAAAIIVGWALLVAIMIALLVAAGWTWWVAAIAFAVLHGVVALICWRLVIRLSRNLTLPALRNVLSKRRRAETAEDTGANVPAADRTDVAT